MQITAPSSWGAGWGDISERQPYRPLHFRSVDGTELLIRNGLFHGCSFLGTWENLPYRAVIFP